MTDELEDRMAEIRHMADEGATYYQGLILAAGNGLESAARADFVIDGRYHHADLRRSPFAGKPELKEKLRQARELHGEIQREIISIAFEARRAAEADRQDRSE